MTAIEQRMASLAALYEGLADTGRHNLSQIQVLGSMARDLRDGDYMPFIIAPVQPILLDGSETAIIGDIQPDGAFHPSVTERMLHIHAQADLWNDLLLSPDGVKIGAVQLLQAITLYAAQISRIAHYLSHTQDDNRTQSFADFISNLPPYMARYFKACLDRDHAAAILQDLKAMDYAVRAYAMGPGGETIHHYPLPASLAAAYRARLDRMESAPETASCAAQ